MGNDRLRVLLFLGSTRAGRVGGRVGSWARTALEARGHTVQTVDPLLLSQQDDDSQVRRSSG
jgi:NAD(P)H-dependent FMN reductase